MAFTISPVHHNELEPFMDYIRDHMSDNGQGVTPLFQPQPRQDPWDDSKLRIIMGTGLSVGVGQKGWRVLWVAKNDDGEIVGHIDLRGQPEPHTEHRALLGIGVHREYRQQGLGGKLLETAIAWAEEQDTLDWIELRFPNTNPAAGRLYQKHGFTLLCTIEDTFRIDEESIGNNIMVKKLCIAPAATEGIDSSYRPYTQHRSSSHTYHYNFPFPAGYQEFHLHKYEARANAAAGNTSDLSRGSNFQQTSWLTAYGSVGGGCGDISFGTPDSSGPFTSFARHETQNQSCESCRLSWPAGATIFKLTSSTKSFRIGWGESGREREGWYPWWSGTIRLR